MSSPVLPDDQTADTTDAATDTSAPELNEVVESLAEPDATGAGASDPEPSVVVSVVVPDRADAPISEITERFFKSVLTKVPLERIEELHLFSPLRQGGVETGIAVIAAREEVVVAPGPIELPLPLTETPPIVDEAPVALTSDEDESPYAESASEDSVEDDAQTEAVEQDEQIEPSEPVHMESGLVESVHVEPVAQADGAEPTAPIVRHTVYTARYRLVQKGPERGKWESEVVAEAEAPLITVEMVVRGVQRRAGEESDTTRFTQAQIARALRIDTGVLR